MKKILLISLLLFSIHFWGLTLLPTTFYNLTNVVSLLIMGFCFIKIMHYKRLQFKSAIILFFIGIAINIISAYINNKQLPLHTFLAFGDYYFILFYFLLHTLKTSRKDLENIIIIFAILYSLFYIFQVWAYPQEIFKSSPQIDRGTIRLRIEGNGFLVLAYFLMLSRFILNRRLISLVFAMAFFTILLMGGFRTLTVATVFLTGLMFFKLTQFNVRYIGIFALIILFLWGLFQFQGTNKILKEMIFSTKNQMTEGKEYIRFVELDFFLNKYPVNKSVYVLGSGLPYGDKNSYSRSMKLMQLEYGLYWEDLGLIGFYIINGVVALLGILWYTLKAIFIKLQPDMLYIKFYFIFLLVVSFTTIEIFRIGIFAVEAIGLYLIDVAVIEDKFSEK